MKNKIKNYWNSRAKEFKLLPTATTRDIYLREIEAAKLIKVLHKLNLPRNTRILDVGCGDGVSVLKLAKEFPFFKFTGIDYSKNMIENARKHLGLNPNKNVSFKVVDIINLKNNVKYDIILSDRCLINLNSLELQRTAVNNIAKCLNIDGYYIAIENFVEGNDNLNSIRRFLGLPDIQIRWHNLFFCEENFLDIAKDLFNSIRFIDFLSSYYILTRAIYSKACQIFNKVPDNSHWCHRVARLFPSIGKCCPVRMVIAKKEK